MQVDDGVKKCVCFVYYRGEGEFRVAGTAFFIGAPVGPLPTEYPAKAESGWGATVTARHVIDGIMGKSDDGVVRLRLNARGGGLVSIETDAADWITHPDGPSTDIAVLPWFPTLGAFDHLLHTTEQVVTDELVRDENINVGDELFLAGLFVNHQGADQNIPIVRIGSIAAMPGEPVNTRLGPMEAYLAESRSIGGLSGSPVFVNLGVSRVTPNLPPLTLNRVAVYLLGVMHGHWDQAIDPLGNETVNMGIAIVTPISKVIEILENREEFAEMKKQASKGQNLPTPDVKEVKGEPGSWGKEDFYRDLDRAIQPVEKPKRKQGES